MRIVAKTDTGFLIEALETEISSILSAVSKAPSKENPVKIGDNIPAFDYAASIQKMKVFKEEYNYREFKNRFEAMKNEGTRLIESFESISL